MAFSVNTNNEGMMALRLLGQTNKGLSQVQERINSGLKVNGARDNSSIFAIAQGMRGDIGSLKAVKQNLDLGQATVGVALDAAQQISNKLNTIKEKVIEGAQTNVDQAAIQRDIAALRTEINAVTASANFNGVNLLQASPDNLTITSSLNRTSPTAVTTGTIAVNGVDSTSAGLAIDNIDVTAAGAAGVTFTPAIGTGQAFADDDRIALTVGGQTTTFILNQAGTATPAVTPAAGDNIVLVEFGAGENILEQTDQLLTAMRDNGFDVAENADSTFTVRSSAGAVTATLTLGAAVLTQAAAPAASNNLNSIESAINTMKTTLSTLGTAANQIESQAEFVSNLKDTMESGLGTLVDADLAEESARLQSLQTKQQLGLQALSIANQQSGAVLSLFR